MKEIPAADGTDDEGSARSWLPGVTLLILLVTLCVHLWTESIRPESSVAFLEEVQSESTRTYYAFFQRFSITPGNPLGLVSAWALHGDWVHWGLNAFQLVLYGGLYERERGHGPATLVFFAGHLAGSLMHLAFGSAGPAIGMSAGTWALIGAVLVDSVRRDLSTMQAALRVGLAALAAVMWFGFDAPDLLPPAHLGGIAMGGGIAALAILVRGRRRASVS